MGEVERAEAKGSSMREGLAKRNGSRAGGHLSRTEALDAGLETGWGLVGGICMKVEVGCKHSAEAARIPEPSKSLEDAWQMTWKQRKLESL